MHRHRLGDRPRQTGFQAHDERFASAAPRRKGVDIGSPTRRCTRSLRRLQILRSDLASHLEIEDGCLSGSVELQPGQPRLRWPATVSARRQLRLETYAAILKIYHIGWMSIGRRPAAAWPQIPRVVPTFLPCTLLVRALHLRPPVSVHKPTFSLLLVTVGAVALAACFNPLNTIGDGDSSSLGEGGGDGAAGSTVANDVPCDVANILAEHCVTCHSDATPKGGVSLTSFTNLTAPSPVDSAQTVAQRSVIRMRDSNSPMPQTGPLAETEIEVVESWVNAGTPQGDCGAAAEPPPVVVVCTSGNSWSQGCHESKDMKPGAACVSCHQNPTAECGDEEDGPNLSFGGTVYPTAHEPDDCIAVGVEGTIVVVTDANGVEHAASVRAGGNFYIEGPALPMPITAEVRRNGNVIKMKDPVDSADCNACHTALGKEDASGRIFPPQ